ncbi:MAG: glycosyltransferase, partial [Planctomycetia bacterium]|nr:glycosyltransferase [Planctomycetia bacterium]
MSGAARAAGVGVDSGGGGLAGRRVLIATFGSLGDLHPFLALGKAVRARGGSAVIATSEMHRGRVERQGLGFYASRPHLEGLENDPELFRRVMDLRTGPEFVIRKLFMRHLRDSYDDLLAAAGGADLLVSHSVAFAGPLVAGVTGIPWVSAVLAPISMLSTHDPSVPPPAPWLGRLRPLGPAFWGPLFWLARRKFRSWCGPVHALRRELGLPPGREPLVEGAHAPGCVLAMFSGCLGAPQPDWPRQAVQTGFAFLDDSLGEGVTPDLLRFLHGGPAPLVFTLGSSAVMDAGRFYEDSLAAAGSVGRRAVLLIGRDPRNEPRAPLPDWAMAVPYAPHSALMPWAAAVVHQGGVGTTGQALRSGRPMLVVPWGFDQPDNAARVVRLGVALTVPRARYSARTAARALHRLLDEPGFSARAAEVGRRVAAEDGASVACGAIDRY